MPRRWTTLVSGSMSAGRSRRPAATSRESSLRCSQAKKATRSVGLSTSSSPRSSIGPPLRVVTLPAGPPPGARCARVPADTVGWSDPIPGGPVEFALFYEIPVARPWSRTSELEAYQHTLTQVVRGEEMGWHAFWSVEHHFLEEYSHCSNPEVLYGAVAARTERMRIGYGVRLAPRPYNHPVRSAESAAVLDLISNGRVEFGTGRSSTRDEMEGFGVHPDETRSMWQGGGGH